MESPDWQIRAYRRAWRIALACTGALTLLALSLVLPAMVRSAEGIVTKLRFTSICCHCGVQTASEFYMVLDTELAHSEKKLPMSRETIMPGRDTLSCSHDYALVGKTYRTLTKRGKFHVIRRGEPDGDREFARAEVKERFAELAAISPADARDYLEALAKQRYRQGSVTNTAVPIKQSAMRRTD